jgi:hypothetical protein
MRNHCFFAMVCVALSALGARGAAQPAGGCRYHAGTPFQAEVRITVSDHEVGVDTAAVSIHEKIPAGGRMVSQPGGQRYVVTLAPVPVHLAKDTLKHFDVIATVIIDHANSAACQMQIDVASTGRGWARQENSHFSITTDVVAGGQHTTYRKEMVVSCLDQDTPVLLKDGTRVPIRQIVRGDVIRNPVTAATAEVLEVIHGTQADEEMVRIGYGSSVVSVTARHPIMTPTGLKPARAVELGDLVLGEDGAYHPVTVREPFAGDAKRLVYNLRLAASTEGLPNHLFSAGGLVTGDYSMQTMLQAAEKPAK